MQPGKRSINIFKLDDFYKTNKEIHSANIKVMSRLSFSMLVLSLINAVILLSDSALEYRNVLLVIFLSIFIAMLCLFYLLYKITVSNFGNTVLIRNVTYIFIIFSYSSTFLISAVTVTSPALIFLLALLIIPLILIFQPKISYFLTLFFGVSFIIYSYNLKPLVFKYDFINTVGVMLINIFLSNYYFKSRKEDFLLRENYKRLSGLDELTGLQNRRQFNINFEKNFFSSINEKKTISVFLIDVDDFKNFNDYYGHLGGDECLKSVAGFFKTIAEKYPYLNFYRYGGEEFIAVAYDIDRPQSEEIAAYIISGVKDLRIRHISSSVSDVITVSVGAVVQYPSIMSNSFDLINLADKALYKAKATGKNNYIFF